MAEQAPKRVLLAKVGLDGHDRGIKVVARGLRDRGFHVIYAGLWQSPEAVVRAAVDEDADWLGLSFLSGAHMTLVPRVLDLLHRSAQPDIRVLIGGIIPEDDIPGLLQLGVAHVFGPGTELGEIAEYLVANPSQRVDPALGVDSSVRHERTVLGRFVTLLGRGEQLDTIAGEPEAASPVRPLRRAKVIAVTGSGGVGKSTLIAKLIDVIRGAARSVAVLACDPQSPITGGALLGDRIRMPHRPDDDGVFIRSLATPSGQSGIAPNLDRLIDLISRFEFDIVVVETVGAGQGDTAIRALADVVVVLVQPQTGDELQWEKAGQLEIADIVVVHKADLPGAERTYSQLRELLNLPGCREVPIICVSSNKGTGFEELWRAIEP
jgi:methylmalonyl-CoA mutase cobalamin-binding domain/chain